MNIEEFIQQNPQQIKSYPLALQALWYDYHDDWHKSHKLIDSESDKDCAWVHAYLHRQEGDLSNARYWYRRSGRTESKLSLSQERTQIAKALLEHSRKSISDRLKKESEPKNVPKAISH